MIRRPGFSPINAVMQPRPVLIGPMHPPVATTPTIAPPGLAGFFNNASSAAGHYLAGDTRRQEKLAMKQEERSPDFHPEKQKRGMG